MIKKILKFLKINKKITIKIFEILLNNPKIKDLNKEANNIFQEKILLNN